MKVAFVSSEVYPFSKTGGLADVSQSLPVALNKKNIDIIILTPLYSTIEIEKFNIVKTSISVKIFINYSLETVEIFKTEINNVNIYFFYNENYFKVKNYYEGDNTGIRFALLCYSAIEFCKKNDFKVDIFHLNDWQTSLISLFLKINYINDSFFSNTKTLLTIHNLAYQGYFSPDILSKIGISYNLFNPEAIEFYGQVNFLKAGILFSDFLNTVSPSYSKEIVTPEAGRGLDGVLNKRKRELFGILNGIDYEIYNPENDNLIFKNYSASSINNKKINKLKLQEEINIKKDINSIIFAFIGRLTEQKGIELIINILENFKFINANIIILGEGDEYYKNLLKKFKTILNSKLILNFSFNEQLARKIYAGADFLLMPSLFEPCGITQLISMRYGTIPVVRAVGGLKDTVDNNTGFLFKNFSKKDFFDIILEAIRVFYTEENLLKNKQINCMRKDFSWESSAKEYIKLYKMLIKEDNV